ncbi:WPP domain-interacting tail-anchored protein 2-like isoform X1 [Silene latifolia]|uniref:WPP domain-interacting tail-anchored protein 2-like isoform X1 n=1 Tax=Silene latifolia TaxID=37657 RepID=UPI003D76AC14
MGMNAFNASDTDDADSTSSNNCVLEKLENGENGVEESGILMEMLTRLDIDLAYSCEKLENLDVYMAIVSLGESQHGEMSMDIEIEKALIFDLSLGYLESEVTELKHLLNVFPAVVHDARKRLHSLGQKRETFTAFDGKLHDSECSLKRFQEQLSALQRRLAIMRGIPYGQKNTFLYEDATSEMSGSDFQTAGQQRLVLRMLDKSLSGELDLEHQLLDSKEREEDLKSKLSITNVVISDLELFGEVALEKLLEAEHSSEVYMGIAKDMMSRLQIFQFNMHCSVQREEELKSKLQSVLIDNETKCAKLNQSFREKEKLEEKVKELEKKLEEVNGCYEASQEEVSLMENTVESLQEHVYMAEIRTQNAEQKITSLTEENIELRDELAYLKDGDDNIEKISLLEKHSRNLEVQLQNANKSSEASLEQQNMLYTAIWDMETLIEELRTKVSRGESRADNAEKQCLALAETNIKLSKEISNLKSDSEKLQQRLKEANGVRVARVKDIYSGAKLISEVVMQLANERERIQKQQSALARENKILLEELRKMRKISLKANEDNVRSTVTNCGADADDPDTGVTIREIVETPTSTTASNQVDEAADESIEAEAEAEAEASSSYTTDIATQNVISKETENKKIRSHVNKKYYIFAAIMVVVLSILAMNINWQEIAYRVFSRLNINLVPHP